MPPPDSEPAAIDPIQAYERRLHRERVARLEAEAIAERATSELYETVQKLTESTRVAELLGQVATQANEADSVATALKSALTSVCAYTGWPLGHAYVLSPDNPELLVSARVWHCDEPEQLSEFLTVSLESTFTPGVGLPGRTRNLGMPLWITDLGADPGFPRAPYAARCGLKTAFAAPVLVRSRTAAVLEFFSRSIQQPDEDLMRLVGFIGAQLGRVIEREDSEKQLRRQALFDGLTGLPNRRLFLDRLTSSVARAQRSGSDLHVLYLDVDDFKNINDSRGHSAGDRVLAIVAARLQQTLRATDTVGLDTEGTVARLGGDEFVMVLEDCDDPEQVARRIEAVMAEPLPLEDGEQMFVSVSVGIMSSSGSSPDLTPDNALAAANVAMHESKRAGKARHVLFEPRMHDEARSRHELGLELRYALDRAELRLDYQPIVDLASGAAIGAEALLRWEHPTRGLLAPQTFISRSEETGLIVAIGAWVLREACRQGAQWQTDGVTDFTVAVNVSGRQLREPGYPASVLQALADTGLPSDCLCLEVTESTFMEHEDAAIAMLTELRDVGVHLAIDDFGTGYSSLAALRRLPVDLLKIDRSFVSSLPADGDAGTIAWAVVRLGHTLGLPVLAEGVETPEQRDMLLEFGCDQAQGFLFGRPVTADVLAESILPTP